jgi:hypothetical protein
VHGPRAGDQPRGARPQPADGQLGRGRGEDGGVAAQSQVVVAGQVQQRLRRRQGLQEGAPLGARCRGVGPQGTPPLGGNGREGLAQLGAPGRRGRGIQGTAPPDTAPVWDRWRCGWGRLAFALS